jgi:hypothetical protein
MTEKIYYHVIEDGGYGNIASRGYYNKLEEAQKEVSRLESYFENISFYVFLSSSHKEPEFITL